MKKSGGNIIVDCLLAEGVDTIFGYPGGAALPIYDALFDSDIKHILTRHEQGAVHAADGYARASGKPGVCIATSGPGATNLVTGIANACMDSIPLVAFTGQVATSLLGKDSFQEADITGITLPITKHNYMVKDINELGDVIKEAFYIATTGRPGPVLVDIPKDVSSGYTEYEDTGPVYLPGYTPVLQPDSQQVSRVVRAIAEAERPVIYAGGGVISSGAYNELRELAEKTLIPVTTTLMGMGCFPGDHPLSLGMLGMHGSKYANYAVSESDLLVGVGVRFDDRVTGKLDTFAPNARIAHFDIDPAEIGKNVRVDYSINGDAKNTLRAVIDQLEKGSGKPWNGQIDRWKEDYPLEFEKNGSLKPQQVIREIYNVTKGQARIATEVGQHQMWAAHYYHYSRPRTFISSGGLGTMGYGFPASLGVQAACPGEAVFDIAGDGSFQMNTQELMTAVNYNLPVKIAILNNGYLGMVRQWQELFFDRRYSYTEIANPDFVKLAEAYGAVGMRITDSSGVRPALEQALEIDRPVVMDFIIEREENVYPMVPPGEAINNMLG
ncbi:MAG: biosynthetic-type acetolactate synthase large subunit [Clostridiales bacterium]|nr:biosynthetic-type acetolactate synthase large subunit [Clostridiales bacterium]MCF8022441.1 biosynthetic-type acetolactate synthase large subunit [Clostridiales bacterium]